ncbi:hypothetical protein QE412_001717 [Microbacterium trichothecenolyticum]|uniref:Uncharacterized protein n=1 Tax=Microbacterium trichothecenolyticum TaxID=69370 RepID=A0ABU0TU05_MICTR|nr:hypothetical protein [Microbacterium trichothecenolyticum]
MVGLGQGEGTEHRARGEGTQPPLLLLGGAEERERAQGEPALHGEDGGERAVVARHLHVDQAGRQRRRDGQVGVVDAIGEEFEFSHASQQFDGVRRGIPFALHARADLVGEGLGPIPGGSIRVGDVGEHRVVVGVAATEQVVVGDAFSGEGVGIGIDGHGSQYRRYWD